MAERFVLAADAPALRVDKALARLIPDVSRATIQRWIAEGRVRIDGRPCRARDRVTGGSVLDVAPGSAPPSRAEPDPAVRFSVLHEDDWLIVVDKPAGVVVHPARGHAKGTLVNGLLARPGFGLPPSDPRDPSGALRPGVVHRLDKDTSGVLVVAKTAAAREALKAQIAARSVERVYTAITLGVPRAGTVDTLHARHPTSRLRFTSRTEVGKPAITEIAVLEVLGSGLAALVECRLHTGRTHQIRVHLAEQTRTPVLGDALYGAAPKDPRLAEVWRNLGRHALHARLLGFTHPGSGQRLRFEAPLPGELAAALEALRALRPRA